MLSEQGFAAWAKRVNLSEDAQSTIAQVRNSDPARRVGGGRSNVTGRYPSRKMGVTIQFESHRVELPAIFEQRSVIARNRTDAQTCRSFRGKSKCRTGPYNCGRIPVRE